MPLVSLGKITVVSAGTPVQVSPTSINCNTVFFQALAHQKGPQIYVGFKDMDKKTLADVLQILEKTATPLQRLLDRWTITSSISLGPFDLSLFYIDADTSGDGLLVSYFAA